jgi:hypothetical protein
LDVETQRQLHILSLMRTEEISNQEIIKKLMKEIEIMIAKA